MNGPRKPSRSRGRRARPRRLRQLRRHATGLRIGARIFANACRRRFACSGVLRIKGRARVAGKAAPAIVQAVGPRVETLVRARRPGRTAWSSSVFAIWIATTSSRALDGLSACTFSPANWAGSTRATPPSISDQSPGDIIVISAADSELAALAAAASRAKATRRASGSANMMRLGHPMSVDLYVEKTAASARLVVVRMMGGAGYWPYGLERAPRARPGRRSGPRRRPRRRPLGRGAGGLLDARRRDQRAACGATSSRAVPENAGRALRFMAHLIGRSDAPAEPEVLAAAGFYWPGEGAISRRSRRRAGRWRAAGRADRLLSLGAPGCIDSADRRTRRGTWSRKASRRCRSSSPASRIATPPRFVEVAFLAASARRGAQHHGLRRLARSAAPGEGGTVLDRPGRPVLPGRARRIERGGVARKPPRARSARPDHECRPPRGRRSHSHARDFVQGRDA